MIEEITENDIKIALIIRSNFVFDGIKFFNDPNDSLQVYMRRKKNYVVKPHLHKKVLRKVHRTMEVLFIKSGSIELDFLVKKKTFLKQEFKKGRCSNFNAWWTWYKGSRKFRDFRS